MGEPILRMAIVDDEPELTKLLADLVKGSINCEIETFQDSVAALIRLQQVKFDIISLDHRMPKLTGMDIVKILRSSPGPNHSTRILLTSGYTEEAKAYEMDPELLKYLLFIDKPVKFDSYIRNLKISTLNTGS